MKLVRYISSGAPQALCDFIEAKGYQAIRVPACSTAPVGIADHPDILMCRLGISDSSRIIHASAPIGNRYPADISYNAACTGKFFVHRLDATAPELLASAKAARMTLIDVRQGYTKCSTVIVDENSIITYDSAIALPAKAAGLSVLKITPGFVKLEGYDTGFIGGTSGRVGNTIVFNGNLTKHPDFTAILNFIEDHGLECKWFEDWELTDIGSII